MAQHDLVVDNGPGLAVRTDLVAALQALATLSSGPLEPNTTYAGMWWLDTSVGPNGSLKMRNLSNTAWTFPSIYGDDRVGEIAYYARPTPPAGWLKANGAIVSRTTYSALFAAIGTQFGIGDGVNTFNLPDVRGRFVRGWDDGAGVDPSRAFGNIQPSAIESHTHPATTTLVAAGSHDHGGGTYEAGSHAHTGATGTHAGHQHVSATGQAFVIVVGGGGGQGTTGSGYSSTGATNVAGAHSHGLTINAAGSHTHAIATDVVPAHTHTATTAVTASGGTETRPANLSLLACIRYA